MLVRMRTGWDAHYFVSAIAHSRVCSVIDGEIFTVDLLPLFFGGGAGSEVMQRIAAPMVGGMVTAPLLSMIIISAAYFLRCGEASEVPGGSKYPMACLRVDYRRTLLVDDRLAWLPHALHNIGGVGLPGVLPDQLRELIHREPFHAWRQRRHLAREGFFQKSDCHACRHVAVAYLTFLRGTQGVAAYKYLESQREAVDADLGIPVTWESKNGKHSIWISRKYPDVLSVHERPDIQRFLADGVNRFVNAFRNRLAKFEAETPTAAA